MKKTTRRSIVIALITVLLITILPLQPSYAVLHAVNAPARVSSFTSSDTFSKEYLKANVQSSRKVLNLSCRTPLKTTLFRISLYNIDQKMGDIDLDIYLDPTVVISSGGTTTYNFTCPIDLRKQKILDGRYYVYIQRCSTDEDAAEREFSAANTLFKNLIIEVANGKFNILQYNDVIKFNQNVREVAALYPTTHYLDTSLQDIKYVLRNPDTLQFSYMTADKIAYIKRIAQRVTSGAYNDYDKLLKLYEYTASNFYYDSVAFQNHARQFAHPYDNIRAYEQGLTTENSQGGRVYTTCQGFSAIVLSMARTLNIPCRFVKGHRLSVPSNDWHTESNIDVVDHWWLEALVDGRWIFIDPTTGTGNKYNSRTNVWTYTGLTNYTYFDPSEAQISTGHLYMSTYQGSSYGQYINYNLEIKKLATFLRKTSTITTSNPNYAYLGAKPTNAQLLTPLNPRAWKTSFTPHYTVNAGQIDTINFDDVGFTGVLTLSGFNNMSSVSARNNGLTTVTLSANENLQNVALQNNKLKNLTIADCGFLTTVDATGNPLKNLTLDINDFNRKFKAGYNGTFYFTMDANNVNSLSLYCQPDIGYKLKGIYNGKTNRRISQKAERHFTPGISDYRIRFMLDPDSYQYTLYAGDSASYKLPYIQAAAKRLKALGYYKPTSTAGTEKSYTSALQKATSAFKQNNGLVASATIDQPAWSLLFSENALAEGQTAPSKPDTPDTPAADDPTSGKTTDTGNTTM